MFGESSPLWPTGNERKKITKVFVYASGYCYYYISSSQTATDTIVTAVCGSQPDILSMCLLSTRAMIEWSMRHCQNTEMLTMNPACTDIPTLSSQRYIFIEYNAVKYQPFITTTVSDQQISDAIVAASSSRPSMRPNQIFVTRPLPLGSGTTVWVTHHYSTSAFCRNLKNYIVVVVIVVILDERTR